MSFGSSPGVDCLLLSTDPSVFVRSATIPADGSCVLDNWDSYDVQHAAAIAHNDGLETEAWENAATAAADAEMFATFPTMRNIVLPLIPILQAVVLFLGRSFAARAGTTPENMAAVAPVNLHASCAQTTSTNSFLTNRLPAP